MNFMRYSAVFLSAFVLWFAADAPSTTSEQAATSTTASAGLNVENFEQARVEAFKSLLGGDFTKGTALLDSVGTLGSDDSIVRAKALMVDYLKVRAKSDAERQVELSSAVRRVGIARLAESYRSELLKSKLDEKLWERIKSIADAVASVDEFLAVNSTSQPSTVRKDVFEHLDIAGEELTSACALIMGRRGPWPEAFRASAKNLTDALDDYRHAWKNVETSSRRSVLKSASERVNDVLIDMGVLATSEPLIAALHHAHEAKELTDDAEAFIRQEWVAELIADADKHGRELVEKGEWLDALMIYGRDGLSGIDADNVAFGDMLKKATRHVRAQNIYGLNGASKTPTTGKSTPTPPTLKSEAPKWRRMISGIDTVMVRTAIERINSNYVKEPDYQKMALAGLDAVRVLADSPRAAETLNALKNEQKREIFLNGVEQQIKRIRETKGTVDYRHVSEALNRVLDLNSDTLNLPTEILNMEFAEGMLSSLDKFTSMIWPYQEEEFRKRTMGSFCGIGVQIRKEPGRNIEIVTPLAGSPAVRAGIRASDYIVRVGSHETKMMDLERAVRLITGKKGTVVTLTIRRAGKSKPFPVNITRDTIHIQTIKGWKRLPSGKWDFLIDPDERIGYIRLTQFTGDTAVELRKVLRGLRRNNPPVRGVIVDMRFNPGGLLTAAEDVSDEFLPRGLIVRIKGRKSQSKKSATALGAYQRGEVIVLVNQYSASAAEIVAGALKDWGRATIVGQRTYGKGSVQRPMPLKSRRAKLKLTTAYYYLPSGRCLHRTNGAKTWGVDPDVSVPVTVRQMNRWAEIRQETDILKNVNADRLTELLKRQLGEDIQLQTAILLMRLKILTRTQPAQPAKAA